MNVLIFSSLNIMPFEAFRYAELLISGQTLLQAEIAPGTWPWIVAALAGVVGSLAAYIAASFRSQLNDAREELRMERQARLNLRALFDQRTESTRLEYIGLLQQMLGAVDLLKDLTEYWNRTRDTDAQFRQRVSDNLDQIKGDFVEILRELRASRK